MDDDLNTPAALAALFDLARDINRSRDDGRDVERRRRRCGAGGVLGLTLREPEAAMGAAPFIDLLVELRNDLRDAKQFELSDRVRVASGGRWGSRWRTGPRERAGAGRSFGTASLVLVGVFRRGLGRQQSVAPEPLTGRREIAPRMPCSSWKRQ